MKRLRINGAACLFYTEGIRLADVLVRQFGTACEPELSRKA